MDNKVVFTLARTLRERGLHVLRFNFRGAGESEGVHDGGRGEVDDVRAALDCAANLASKATTGTSQLLLAGFSFGSFVGLTAGRDDPRVGGLLAVAPPVNHYAYPSPSDIDKPLCVIYAEQDELVPAPRILAWVGSRGPLLEVHAIAGATHLFHGHLKPLRQCVDHATRTREKPVDDRASGLDLPDDLELSLPRRQSRRRYR